MRITRMDADTGQPTELVCEEGENIFLGRNQDDRPLFELELDDDGDLTVRAAYVTSMTVMPVSGNMIRISALRCPECMTPIAGSVCGGCGWRSCGRLQTEERPDE